MWSGYCAPTTCELPRAESPATTPRRRVSDRSVSEDGHGWPERAQRVAQDVGWSQDADPTGWPGTSAANGRVAAIRGVFCNGYPGHGGPLTARAAAVRTSISRGRGPHTPGYRSLVRAWPTRPLARCRGSRPIRRLGAQPQDFGHGRSSRRHPGCDRGHPVPIICAPVARRSFRERQAYAVLVSCAFQANCPTVLIRAGT